MGKKTKIEWCHSTASPWNGCKPVSPGCAHCYASARDKRHLDQPKAKRNGQAPVCHWGKGAPRVAVPSFEKTMLALDRKAARMGKPLTVFPSTCDPFDDEVPIEMFANYLRVVFETRHLIHLMLTKRPELWAERMDDSISYWMHLEPTAERDRNVDWLKEWRRGRPPTNVWVGVSIEDQRRADERIPELLKIPARVRFLSVEPLLGPVDLHMADRLNELLVRPKRGQRFECRRIDWVIVGGESGPGARLCNIEWIGDIVRQCKAAGVPCFVKQLGTKPEITEADIHNKNHHWLWRMRDPKGGNMAEWPEDLRVREWPEPKTP